MATNKNSNWDDFDARRTLAMVVENGVFILGMILMFFKTMDLAIAFAPGTIGGYTGLEVYYGIGVALIVEGVVIAMKFSIGGEDNPYEWLWGVVVLAVPFLISALAQVMDGFLVRETLASQPENIQFLVSWGVPSIPTLVMGLLIVKSIFHSLPESFLRKRPKPGAGAPVAATQLPTGDMMTVGHGGSGGEPIANAQPANPTNGRRH